MHIVEQIYLFVHVVHLLVAERVQDIPELVGVHGQVEIHHRASHELAVEIVVGGIDVP